MAQSFALCPQGGSIIPPMPAEARRLCDSQIFFSQSRAGTKHVVVIATILPRLLSIPILHKCGTSILGELSNHWTQGERLRIFVGTGASLTTRISVAVSRCTPSESR